MTDDAPPVGVPWRARLWWRVVVVVAAVGLGVCCSVAFGVGWLLMGFMGTDVEPWEPVVYPAGVVLGLAGPVVVGWWLFRRRPGALRWVVGALGVSAAVVAAMGAVTLGAF